MEFSHQSVLLDEIVGVAPSHTLRILDCTLGGGGHSSALLERFPAAYLHGLDRDPESILAAQQRLAPLNDRVTFHHGRFSEIGSLFAESPSFDYILADIGVSSYQFDEPARGFSFSKPGPLDMRMDAESGGMTALDLIETSTVEELTDLFWMYGEEKFSKRIAQKIVEERAKKLWQTTTEFAQFVAACIPKKFHPPSIHPATRVFQALRITVNEELSELENLLTQSLPLLAPEGRLAVIAFHSLEDRRVKQQFVAWAHPCSCPSDMPYCVCKQKPWGEILSRKPLIAAAEEIQRNPRSRSAKLRVFCRASQAH